MGKSTTPFSRCRERALSRGDEKKAGVEKGDLRISSFGEKGSDFMPANKGQKSGVLKRSEYPSSLIFGGRV